MAGSDVRLQHAHERDALPHETASRSTPRESRRVRLTNSVQDHREKQTSYQGIRVASGHERRMASVYAQARALGTEMDEQETHSTPEVDESVAWLDFLEECRQILATSEEPAADRAATLTPGLFFFASRLHTRTARVLARVMITRLAERLATTPSARKANLPATPLSVANADSLLQPSAPPVLDPRVRTVLQYVEARHVNSGCRLDDVARNLRVSRSYLSRLVFKETGVTFNRHLQLARMNTAARLLQESDLSIKEISSGTGYEHVPSFDRQFRSHFKLTPGDFRRATRLS
jgi:AraC-like DNA-binding protein